MSDRMASEGTRSSGPEEVSEEVSSKAPGSKSATPANGMTCRPFSPIYSSWKNCLPRAAYRRDSSRQGPGRHYAELTRLR